jgi:hypothetical protein
MKMSLYLIYEKKRSKIFKPKYYETEHQESFFGLTGAGSYGVFSDGTKGGQRQGRKG